MEIPHDLLQNTSALLSAIALVLGFGGILFSLVFGLALYLSVQSAQSAVMPELDVMEAVLEDTAAVLEGARISANETMQGGKSMADALAFYSNSSSSLADSLSDAASLPLFSLDDRISSSAQNMRRASASFADASVSIRASSAGMAGAAAGLTKAEKDIVDAKKNLTAARQSFSSAFSMLGFGAIAATAAAAALFSSVIALSLSSLLVHYPRLFSKDEGRAATRKAP